MITWGVMPQVIHSKSDIKIENNGIQTCCLYAVFLFQRVHGCVIWKKYGVPIFVFVVNEKSIQRVHGWGIYIFWTAFMGSGDKNLFSVIIV